ncbi:hypothetical protein GCM10009715_23460 [Paeniglutamicibacter psychrophenolicus]|uniref:SHOCT domain-containing protein n=1 Tax=Paeniglutamicibacter psychrophenolicus TaxID=257454 RepID=A0ABS4WHT7_9MICC|nr:SHOCT domain-containing protein [Paeniglutamicibacter psychrophenolicus]MBP2375777.1 hypothetical protein [Paeniglutamicibacter psychrophenolicus]
MNLTEDFLVEQESVDFGMVQPDPFGNPNPWNDLVVGFGVFGVLFAIAFVAMIGFIVFVVVRNYKASKNAGLDPFTLQTELAVRAAKSQMLAPRQSREQRLAELEDLLARRVITPEEYQQARMKILTED